LGEGKGLAAFTFLGVVFGTYLYALFYPYLGRIGIPLEK
jgi:hypothetical protein